MALEDLLARQAGVISRDQALRVGLSAAAVDRLVRTRRWLPLHPRVYLVPGHGAPGDGTRARAALLWAGAGAVLSGVAAAWWHGLLPEAPATLAVTTSVPRPPRPGISVRYRPLDAADRAEHRGLAVTALGLTVLEAAVELGGPAGALLVDGALAGRIGWADLVAAHRRNPAAGAGRVLAAADARSATVAGALLVRLLRRWRLRGWHRLPTAPGRPTTVVFPAAGLVVEVVGWDGAPGRSGRARVLRFALPELVARPGEVAASIAAAVGDVISATSMGRRTPLTGDRR